MLAAVQRRREGCGGRATPASIRPLAVFGAAQQKIGLSLAQAAGKNALRIDTPKSGLRGKLRAREPMETKWDPLFRTICHLRYYFA